MAQEPQPRILLCVAIALGCSDGFGYALQPTEPYKLPVRGSTQQLFKSLRYALKGL